MIIKQYLRFVFIFIGVVVALAIVALTVINVKKVQNRQILASKLDCHTNWCKATIQSTPKGPIIQITSPYTATYPVKSFLFNPNTKLNQSLTIKGVVKDNFFYITNLR